MKSAMFRSQMEARVEGLHALERENDFVGNQLRREILDRNQKTDFEKMEHVPAGRDSELMYHGKVSDGQKGSHYSHASFPSQRHGKS